MAEVSLPVYFRVGDLGDFHVGNVTCLPGEDPAEALARFFRELARDAARHALPLRRVAPYVFERVPSR